MHDRLLATFLEIDKEAETTAEEKALRGVRKAQAKLAAYYLVSGREARARRSTTTWRWKRRTACARSATRCCPSPPRTSGRSSIAAPTSTTWTNAAKKSCASSSTGSANLEGAPGGARGGPGGALGGGEVLVKTGLVWERVCNRLVVLFWGRWGGGGGGGGGEHTNPLAGPHPVPAPAGRGGWVRGREAERGGGGRRTANSALESLERDTDVAGKEKEQAQLEIEKAISEQEGAKASRDENQANAAAHNKDVADLGVKVVEAKLDWLSEKKDWLKQVRRAAESHVEAAKAKVEFEKAKVAQQKGIKPSGDFDASNYEGQWKSKNSDWQSEKKDAESEEKDAKKKEEHWRDLATQFQKLKG